MLIDSFYYSIGVAVSLGVAIMGAAVLVLCGAYAWVEILSAWKVASVFKPRPKGIFNTPSFKFAMRLQFAAKWFMGVRPESCYASFGTQGGTELVFHVDWLKKEK